MILAAAIAAVAPVAIFAPPLDRALIYDMVETRRAGRATLRFELTMRVVFRRVGAGYRMDTTQIAHRADAPAAIAAIYDAGLAPFEGITTSLFVTRDGAPGAVIDGDAVWAKVRAAHDRVLAAHDARPDSAAIRTHLAAIAAADSEARDAMMGQWSRELLRPPGADGGVDRIETRAAGTIRTRAVTVARDTGLVTAIDGATRAEAGNALLSERTIRLRR